MRLVFLDENKWQKILAFLQTEKRVNIGKEANCKRFIEAVLWMARSGAPWRYLPKEYGKWYTIYHLSKISSVESFRGVGTAVQVFC